VFLVVSWADSSPAISHHAGAHSAGPRAFFLLPGDSVGARAGGFFFPWGLLAVLHAASVFFLTGRRLTTGSDFVVSRRNRSAKDELAGILARMEALQARQDGAS